MYMDITGITVKLDSRSALSPLASCLKLFAHLILMTYFAIRKRFIVFSFAGNKSCFEFFVESPLGMNII